MIFGILFLFIGIFLLVTYVYSIIQIEKKRHMIISDKYYDWIMIGSLFFVFIFIGIKILTGGIW